VGLSAQPEHEPDPDDPVEILRVLPARAAERDAVRTGSVAGSVPIEEVVPGWPGRP